MHLRTPALVYFIFSGAHAPARSRTLSGVRFSKETCNRIDFDSLACRCLGRTELWRGVVIVGPKVGCAIWSRMIRDHEMKQPGAARRGASGAFPRVEPAVIMILPKAAHQSKRGSGAEGDSSALGRHGCRGTN